MRELTPAQKKELQEAKAAAKEALGRENVPFRQMTIITQRLLDAMKPTFECNEPYPHRWHDHRSNEYCILPIDHDGEHFAEVGRWDNERKASAKRKAP